MRSSGVYSPNDRIVGANAAFNPELNDISESVHVPDYHLSMAISLRMHYLIAERLAQPSGKFEHFNPEAEHPFRYPEKPLHNVLSCENVA